MRKLAAGLLAIAGVLSIGLFSGCVRKSEVESVEIRNAPGKEGTEDAVHIESAASVETEPATDGVQGGDALKNGGDLGAQSEDAAAENGETAAGESVAPRGDDVADGEAGLVNEEGEDMAKREHVGRIRHPAPRGDRRMGKKKEKRDGALEGDEDAEAVIREYRKLPAEGRAVALYGIRALYGVESY